MKEENEIKEAILKRWTMFDYIETFSTPGCVHIIVRKSIDGLVHQCDYLLSIWQVRESKVDIIDLLGERLFLSLYENYAKSLLDEHKAKNINA